MPDLVQVKPDVAWQPIEGEAVVLDLNASAYVSLNHTGALLWELLVAGATRAQLVDRLSRSFPLDRERAEADVETFLAQLRAMSLLAGTG